MCNSFKASSLSRVGLVVALLIGGFAMSTGAQAFCGFYVAKADTKRFNKASQVVLARDGDRTVLTMASDDGSPLGALTLVRPQASGPLNHEQPNITEGLRRVLCGILSS